MQQKYPETFQFVPHLHCSNSSWKGKLCIYVAVPTTQVRLLPNCTLQERQYKVRSVLLFQHERNGIVPQTSMDGGGLFSTVQYAMANFNTICQKFKVLLINLQIKYSQNIMDPEADFSCPMPPVVSCSVSKTWHNFQDRNIKMTSDVCWCFVFHQLTGNSSMA